MKYESLYPVKCIWPYLSQRSKSATQEFTEFFITYGKPQHLASKDLFAQSVKEVMANFGRKRQGSFYKGSIKQCIL